MTEQNDEPEFLPDPNNLNRGTKRGRDLLEKSLERYGAGRSVLASADGVILAGNKTMEAAMEKGIPIRVIETDGTELVLVRRTDLPYADPRAKELALADNRVAEVDLEWDPEMLAALKADGVKIEEFFFENELARIMGKAEPTTGNTAPDETPDERPTDIKLGDLFQLGNHRLLCGDTTSGEALNRLFDGAGLLSMIHADPPYGMGKESEGIANDNLTGAKLDAFQMDWYNQWRGFLEDNGSLYIWGNAPDLWRLWWKGGLQAAQDLVLRNEIVWDKGSAFGMTSEGAHSYPPSTERCLFMMRGQQFLGNRNKEDFWEGFEPLLLWLLAEREKMGWANKDINALTETQMAGHWFSRSQFQPISRKHYEILARAAEGRAFVETYDELIERLGGGDGGNAYRRELSARMRETRSYFDNTHEKMTDVWQFPRVVGEERFGHATPKPVDMVVRAMKSSSAPGDAIGVPFAGTCPEIIAAETLGRRCFAMEVNPSYCQVVIDRWEKFTGREAVKVEVVS